MTKEHRTPRQRATVRTESAAGFAEESERLAERYPEERETLLLEAAGEWSAAGEHTRALALYNRLLAEGAAEPDLVDAFRIGELWEAGRTEQARAAAEAFRVRHPRHPGAWNIVAEHYEMAEETATAAECFTAALAHILGTADVVKGSRDSDDLESLVIGRHRVRRKLGEPHDDWDDAAHEVHDRRALPLLGRVRPLDEMHDPGFMERFVRESLDAPPAEHGPLKTCVLYWPKDEFADLLARHPAVAGSYGDDHPAHLRQVEHALRELSDQGAVRLAVGRATVDALEAYTRENGGSPDNPGTRSAYAADLARTGRTADWPPPRNGPCWCGSGRKYKKCCGNPALG
ncbi:hypothetical protein DF268_22940 [Streptomyces sp. V2]|uniref:SEC-C domain-containing protein n=1 Tax=Streptomyces TaxID=1883 RepID=UPI0006EBAA8B|nr:MULTISPECIES: SEC-C metal-binding domain-containing protein [Streptomyces]PWG11197.1 hypothetical protein DF268_22940 [Streptomyces sp. V2]